MLTNQKGSSLMELVVGLSLIILIVSALAISTATSLQSSQFSKNQIQATKLAQEGLEKVRLIKTKEYGVCRSGQTTCSVWKNLWVQPLFTANESGCTDCKYVFSTNCNTVDGQKPVCLQSNTTPTSLPNGFSQQIILLDEAGLADQKKIISRVTWTDSTGTHKSELISVLSQRSSNE